MRLALFRYDFSGRRTIGKLSVDGVFHSFSLEDCVRAEKIPGATAIPYGTYPVILNQSVRFKRFMPLLLNVPNFSGVRIHPGNTEADTEGCILVGMLRGPEAIYDSRRAFDSLMARLESVYGREPITITISRAAPPLVA